MATRYRWCRRNRKSINQQKHKKIYDEIDNSPFGDPTQNTIVVLFMNITWRAQDESLEAIFVEEAEKQGLKGLKGHRSVGGIRASIYNACSPKSVDALTDFMKDFAQRHG